MWPSIPNKNLVDYLVRKNEVSKTIGGENGFPEDWKQLNEYDFWVMVRNLDKLGHGFINWRLLATYLCLLKSPIPLEKESDAF